MFFLFFSLFFSLILLIGVLISVAFYTLLDRKLLGAMQRRLGPTKVGFFGLLQPLSDGIKLFLKETILPTTSNSILFLLAPFITFVLSLLSWSVIPFSSYGSLLSLNSSLLFLFATSGLSILGILLAGWSANSKYAFLGAIRASSQMISYEVSLGLIILSVLILANSSNLIQITIMQANFGLWNIWFLFPQSLLFLISAICETNRTPFDLPEAEAELVAGYMTDHAAFTFALFFLAEYSSMLIMSILFSILFLGGFNDFYTEFEEVSNFWLSFKNSVLCFLWVHIRATLPRYRFDQLLSLGWKIFLPISISLLIFNSSFLLIMWWFLI